MKKLFSSIVTLSLMLITTTAGAMKKQSMMEIDSNSGTGSKKRTAVDASLAEAHNQPDHKRLHSDKPTDEPTVELSFNFVGREPTIVLTPHFVSPEELYQQAIKQTNPQEAVRLYKLAADQGYAPAQNGRLKRSRG